MREMKPSSMEWVGDIPASWKVMPNKYLMHKKKEICPVYNGEDILSLTMKGVIVRDFDAGGNIHRFIFLYAQYKLIGIIQRMRGYIITVTKFQA